MGTVSTTLPSDGQTIDAADVNTPINAILSEFNGNIDNDNIKSAAAINGSKIADATITNAKLSTTAGELGGAWVSFTPTLEDITTGTGGANTGYYTQIGKTVIVRGEIELGTGASVSISVGIVLPITPNSNYGTTFQPVGNVTMVDTSASIDYTGFVTMYTSGGVNIAFFQPHNASATYAYTRAVQNTIPFTWASGDKFHYQFTYEAA